MVEKRHLVVCQRSQWKYGAVGCADRGGKAEGPPTACESRNWNLLVARTHSDRGTLRLEAGKHSERRHCPNRPSDGQTSRCVGPGLSSVCRIPRAATVVLGWKAAVIRVVWKHRRGTMQDFCPLDGIRHRSRDFAHAPIWRFATLLARW